jgi:hypothetical protein
MRIALGMFGLVGLLVVTAVIMLSFVETTSQVSKSGAQARTQAEQIAGVSSSGMRVTESAILEPKAAAGGTKPQSLVVTHLAPSGPMAQHFGLAQDDQIVEVGTAAGLTRVRDFNDAEEATAFAFQAYNYKLPLVVVRGGRRMQLPAAATPAQAAVQAPADPTAAPQQPAVPQPAAVEPTNPAAAVAAPEAPAAAPQPPRERTNVWDQVRGIPGVQKPAD